MLKMENKQPIRLTKEEKENRYQTILSLFRKGWSRVQVSEHIAELWSIKRQSAAIWIKESYKYLNANSESFIKNFRHIQLERLELMLQKAMEQENWKVANSIADTMNRLFSLYEIKQKVEITENVIRFKFCDSPIENPYPEKDCYLTDEEQEIVDEANKTIIE